MLYQHRDASTWGKPQQTCLECAHCQEPAFLPIQETGHAATHVTSQKGKFSNRSRSNQRDNAKAFTAHPRQSDHPRAKQVPTTTSNSGGEAGNDLRRSMSLKYLNYYAVLGIPISANRDEIIAAYDRQVEQLGRRHHVNPGELPSSSSTKENDECAEPLMTPPLATTATIKASKALQARLDLTPSSKASKSPLPATITIAAPPATFILPDDTETLSDDNDPITDPAPKMKMNHHDNPWDPANIIRLNAIEDAFQTLFHPVKKKAYDLTFHLGLFRWEARRIISTYLPRYPDSNASRGKAEAAAKRWRRSLFQVGDGARKGEGYDEAEFNRVERLADYGWRERGLLTASMVCGEVVAGWLEGMDL